MEKKRIFCMLLSMAVLFSIAASGTLAIAAEEADADEGAIVEATEPAEPTEGTENEGEALTSEETTGVESEPSGKIPAADDEQAAGDDSLFEKLMAAATLEEFDQIAAAATEEELAALTDEENAQIEAHIEAMEPEPLPAVVIDEAENQPVPSEIVQGTVNFSNVAPLGDPVVGGEA
ncbi:MAG: hypothetical protein ACI4LJ_00475 [Anaerovoracaceae bacterium]